MTNTARKRFHELAVKEALGTIAPEELAKLERLDALRERPDSSHADKILAKTEFQLRCLRKAIGKKLHQPNRA